MLTFSTLKIQIVWGALVFTTVSKLFVHMWHMFLIDSNFAITHF
jgi:hypothetical protein